MRVEFTQTAHQILEADPQAFFMTGDLGFNAFEGLQKSFGKRFINAGAAEQNMVGVAAGLAYEGFKPWVYSIAPFVTYRVYEQIRNDVCLHNLPVRIAGNGGGYTYGVMGSTHYTLEDLGILKTLPNMTIFFPCVNNQVPTAVKAMANLAGPSYLRLAFPGFQSNAEALSENPQTLTRRYSKGSRVTLIGVGHATQIALKALEENLISSDDVSIFAVTRFPFDLASDKDLVDHVAASQKVLVIDEHYLAGSMAESLKMALPTAKHFVAMTATYRQDQSYGSPKFMEIQTGLTPTAIAEHAAALLR